MNIVHKTINLYKGAGWKSWFTKFKFWEEPYTEVEKLLPEKGKIIDLGCGDGIFANFLALCSQKREIYGFEINKERLQIAPRGIPNAKFEVGDITKINISNADAIVLFHVLHHLSSLQEQEQLLKKCFASLSKNGKLMIVEIEVKPSLKYLAVWLTDYFLVPWVFEKKLYSPALFRHSSQWGKLLTNLGYSCKIIPAEAGKPFPNVIFECQPND